MEHTFHIRLRLTTFCFVFEVIFHCPSTVPIQRTQVTKNTKNTRKWSLSAPKDASDGDLKMGSVVAENVFILLMKWLICKFAQTFQ